MKTKLLVTFCFLASTIMVMRAQDIITKTNGDEIRAKVTEVDVNEVKYKKFENPSGPTYTIAKSDVFMIKYENGDKDVFKKSSDSGSAVSGQRTTPNQNVVQNVSANRNTGTGQNLSSTRNTSSTEQRTNVKSSPVSSGQNQTEYRHRSPAGAFWLSFLYPGIGQFYNGQVGKGVVMSVLFTGSFVTMAAIGSSTDSSGYISDSDATVVGVSAIVLVGTYIWSLIDAPVSASAINRRNQPLSWNLGKERKLSIVPDVLSDNSALSKISRQSPSYGLSLKLDF